MNFYVMKQDVTSNEDTYAERMEPIKTGDFDICEICGHALGLRKWVPPYNVKFKGGAKGDIVYVDYLHVLVSQSLMEAYKKTDLRGIVNFTLVANLKVTGKKRSAPIPKYYKVDLVRSGTRIDEKRSQLKREFDEGQQYCQVCQTGGVITSLNGVFSDVNS